MRTTCDCFFFLFLSLYILYVYLSLFLFLCAFLFLFFSRESRTCLRAMQPSSYTLRSSFECTVIPRHATRFASCLDRITSCKAHLCPGLSLGKNARDTPTTSRWFNGIMNVNGKHLPLSFRRLEFTMKFSRCKLSGNNFTLLLQ